VLWVASRTPGSVDPAGFFAGMGLLLVSVAVFNRDVGASWALVGGALAVLAVVAYATVPERNEKLGR